MKKLNLGIFYFITIIYLEIVFRILKVEEFFSINVLTIILYSIPIAAIFSMLGKMFKNEKVNKIINIVLIFLLCFWFNVHFIYSEIFDVYFSFSLLKLADQAASFWKEGMIGILNNLIGVVALLVPFVTVIVCHKKIEFQRLTKKTLLISLLTIFVTYLLFMATLLINKDKSNSNYELYFKVNNNALNIEKLGLINATTLDIKRLFSGFEEKIQILLPQNKPINPVTVYDYNTLDIDFETLIANEKNSTLKNMHEYFNIDTGTLQNEYTGYYEGKNLILFMAETFNEIAVSKELTPTLYKLVNSSFVFNNYYTQTNNSTIGGEFQELTGLFANNSILSTWKKGTNTFPMGLSTVFENINYQTYAYHNNSYSFQNRHKYLKALGFDNYVGCFNGLEKKIKCKGIWPQSDVAMIEATYGDWINSDDFMVFYATVSGHGEYSWGNSMSKKHKEAVKDLPYSEKVKAYLAAQIELDKALELLLQKLEENNRLEDTVIALVGDHYPYYLTIDEINEAASYKKDAVVEVNRSHFILWNSKTPTKVINKVTSQIDVLPTLYNLFGIDYDSRLIMGKDALSTEDGLAIFSNRSWVSDAGTYFATSHKFISKTGESATEEYIERMNQIVANRINMSKLIIEKDYYKKVLGD